MTEAPQSYEGLPPGTRAITIYDPQTVAPPLDFLGRCSRSATCEEGSVNGGLPAKLHLLNGPLLNAKIIAKDGLLARLLAGKKTDREIVREFYCRALGRDPSAKEMEFWLERIEKAGASSRGECLEDFAWSLLNSREFDEPLSGCLPCQTYLPATLR